MLKHYVQWVPHHHIGLGNSKLYVLCPQLGHFFGPFHFPTQEGFKHPVADNRERETRINDRALHCKHWQFSKGQGKARLKVTLEKVTSSFKKPGPGPNIRLCKRLIIPRFAPPRYYPQWITASDAYFPVFVWRKIWNIIHHYGSIVALQNVE